MMDLYLNVMEKMYLLLYNLYYFLDDMSHS